MHSVLRLIAALFVWCLFLYGQTAPLDIRAHHNDVGKAIGAVRGWLPTNHPDGLAIPGAKRIQAKYVQFRLDLPTVARAASLSIQELNFLEYGTLVDGWLNENTW